MNEKELDKFYTKNYISKFCYEKFIEEIKNKINLDDVTFIEPSAGSGSFLNQIEYKKIGYDILPTADNIIKLDFLTSKIKIDNCVIIGNPPFGKKSKLAIEFLNKALSMSDYVGFILPIQFRKWSVQSKIDNIGCLVKDYDLPEDAFEFKSKSYSVRCCFQIWENIFVADDDLRLKHKPEIEHSDFEIYQYNCTDESRKYFDYDWDFAVHRQGYVDYKKIYYSKNELNPKQQYIFFKASEDILNKLLSIDFEKLSKNNIGIPGFGKHDVVTEYRRMYESYI